VQQRRRRGRVQAVTLSTLIPRSHSNADFGPPRLVRHHRLRYSPAIGSCEIHPGPAIRPSAVHSSTAQWRRSPAQFGQLSTPTRSTAVSRRPFGANRCSCCCWLDCYRRFGPDYRNFRQPDRARLGCTALGAGAWSPARHGPTGAISPAAHRGRHSAHDPAGCGCSDDCCRDRSAAGHAGGLPQTRGR
jgi:hypothetical protein